MSELTETVRKMLSQAQVFARDTPFEAVARARQALKRVDAALAQSAAGSDDRLAIENLRRLTAARLARHEAQLASWIERSRDRGEAYIQREREVIGMPLRMRA